MIGRELTPDFVTQLESGNNRPAFFFESVFSPGAIRLWTGNTSISHDSYGYNLFSFPEQLDNTDFWTASNVSITPNDTTAPDGTTTADLITGDATAGYHVVQQTSSEDPPIVGAQYKISGYFKENNSQYMWLGEVDDTNFHGISVDLTNGTIPNDTGYVDSSDIQDAGNGWYYVELVFTRQIAGGTDYNIVYISLHDSDSASINSSWDATGYDLYAWGIKLQKITTNTFEGNGYLRSITSPTEVDTIQPAVMKVELSGVPATVRSIVLNNTSNRVEGKLWFAMMDSSWTVVSNDYLLFTGYLDAPQITETGNATSILLPYETRLANLNRRRELRYTNEQQLLRYPGDVGLQYVPQAQEWTGYWGTGETFKNFRRRDRR